VLTRGDPDQNAEMLKNARFGIQHSAFGIQ
jgi:hypothetical protein